MPGQALHNSRQARQISEQTVARHTTALDGAAKLVKRLDLDLPHPFTRQAKLFGNVFQRADFRIVQPVAPL